MERLERLLKIQSGVPSEADASEIEQLAERQEWRVLVQAPALYKYIGARTGLSGLAIADHFISELPNLVLSPFCVFSFPDWLQFSSGRLTVANEAGTFTINSMCFCLKFDELLVVSLNHANSLLGRSLVLC